ncbi:hypothetical protein EVAR_60618_1 [Eumeta japonica]|uniref:Mutator-like transposase domain-containing protein n=1 Tax=Eumeta variegata TaxID=151549 RepID=A0A4C1YEG5_EUMVA|nr:hypothetical protein EVAR_60618_1 [Eumeta japonica]
MIKSGAKERQAALDEGRVTEEGIPITYVVADGYWSKRSYKTNYSALSGAAAVIGKRFGEVLFLGVRNNRDFRAAGLSVTICSFKSACVCTSTFEAKRRRAERAFLFRTAHGGGSVSADVGRLTSCGPRSHITPLSAERSRVYALREFARSMRGPTHCASLSSVLFNQRHTGVSNSHGPKTSRTT